MIVDNMHLYELSDEELKYEYVTMLEEMRTGTMGLSGEDGAYMERLITELLYRLATDEFDA